MNKRLFILLLTVLACTLNVSAAPEFPHYLFSIPQVSNGTVSVSIIGQTVTDGENIQTSKNLGQQPLLLTVSPAPGYEALVEGKRYSGESTIELNTADYMEQYEPDGPIDGGQYRITIPQVRFLKTATSVISGDLNNDNTLSVADVTTLVEMITGNREWVLIPQTDLSQQGLLAQGINYIQLTHTDGTKELIDLNEIGNIEFLENNPTVVVTSIALSATSLSLKVGESSQLTATVSPQDATNKGIVWKTSDSKVATVADGLIQAVGKGVAVITAESTDGSHIVAECQLTVLSNATTYAEQTITTSGTKTLSIEAKKGQTLSFDWTTGYMTSSRPEGSYSYVYDRLKVSLTKSGGSAVEILNTTDSKKTGNVKYIFTEDGTYTMTIKLSNITYPSSMSQSKPEITISNIQVE